MNTLTLKLLWDRDNLKEEVLSGQKEDCYTYSESLSTENKSVFVKNDFWILFKKKLQFSVLAILGYFLLLYLSIDYISPRFGSVLLIGFGILILGALSSLYGMPKAIIIDKDKQYFVNRIIKKNFAGIGVKILDLEYPEKINRLVISKGNKKSYLTFRTENGDKIPNKSPIIVINNECNQGEKILEIITHFIENANHEISITNLQLLK